MKIYVKNDDGTTYEALRINENTYTFKAEDKTYKLSLSEANPQIDYRTLTEEQKKKMTKAIFSNEDVLDQLRDARKNRDQDFSYYSGDEKEFERLVDEINNDNSGFGGFYPNAVFR